MATGSADGSDLSIAVPPPLEEWLDERADALDVDREEVVVQLLASYRAVADLEDQVDDLEPAVSVENRVVEELDDRLEGFDPDALTTLQDHVMDLESDVDEKVEDLRRRVLQVRDAMQNRAEADHDHPEFEELSEDVERLTSDLEEVAIDLANLSDTVETLTSRLEDLETRQTRLARVVVAMRDEGAATDSSGGRALEHVRRVANREGVSTAACSECRRRVRIGLLSAPECPHCDAEFADVSVPESVLGPLDPRKPKLVGSSSTGSGDDDE